MTQTTPTRDEAVPTGWQLVPVEPTFDMRIAGSNVHDQRPSEVVSIYRAMLASAPAPASGRVDAVADLDSRMKTAGMIPLSDLIAGNTPLGRWAAHTGVSDLNTFEQWLGRRQREFGAMKASYELGDKDKDDELYEWVLSHFAAFNEVAANLRQMKARMALSPAATPVSCTYCGDTKTITDRVDGEITCPECGYEKRAATPVSEAGGDPFWDSPPGRWDEG